MIGGFTRAAGAVSVVALVAALSAAPIASEAQSITLDAFSTNQAALTLTFPPAGTSASSSVSGGGILGGERDIEIDLTAGVIAGNSMTAVVSSGFFSYSQDATIAGTGRIEWDGADGSATLNPTGLGGIDLTAGGTQDALLLNVQFDDLPVDVTIEVFTDAGNASAATFSLPGLIFASTNFVIPYSSFTPTLGAGADFTDVGAVTLTVGSNVTAPDLVIDFFATTSTLTAPKTVVIQNDVDGDTNADPGDTLRYTIVITNPDDAFDASTTGVAFTNNAPANTTLVTGSVTTTQGTVTTGNGGGDTSVAVNIGTIADGGTVTITFDVLINNPLPAGVTQISCQGTVTSDTLTNLPTDDPGVGGPADPTVIPVTADPLVTAAKTSALFTDVNGNGVVNPGDTLQYTIVITNNGNEAAAGVVFTDSAPANTTLVVGSVTTSQGAVTTGNTAGDTSVSVNVGTIPGGGGSVTIQLRVTINDPLPAGVTQITNQGQVTGTNIPATVTNDPATGTPDDPTATPVTADPLVTAAKTSALFTDVNGNGLVNPGDTLQYTIVITNNGNEAAAGVVFTDSAPANTTLVVGSVTTSQGTVTTGNTAGDTSVSVNVGTIPGGGGSVTIQLRVTINDPLPAGVTQITNQGQVTGTNIPPTVTNDPATGTPDDPTATPVVVPSISVVEIPTLSEWGLLALILMLSAIGLRRMRRNALG